jgi:hypothetical protein
LFAISDAQPQLRRALVEAPVLTRAGKHDWQLQTGHEPLLLRPFPFIGEEVYQTYSKIV